MYAPACRESISYFVTLNVSPCHPSRSGLLLKPNFFISAALLPGLFALRAFRESISLGNLPRPPRVIYPQYRRNYEGYVIALPLTLYMVMDMMVTNMAYMHACACACAYACTCSLDEICAATRDARDGSVHIHASMRGSGSRALSRDGNSRTSRAPEARRHAMSHARLRATEWEAAWQVAENLVHLCACLGELSASQGEVVPRLHTR